jgi:lysophospholipase L1-like esterase
LFQALNTIASNFPSVTLIDLWTPFVEAIGGTDQLNNPTAWNAYLCDGIHPTPKGNELIASVIAPYLLKTEG